MVNISDIHFLKKTGLCFTNISIKEIITCITSSEDFLRKYSGIHYVESKNLYVTIATSENEPFYPRGLLQMKFFSSIEDIDTDLYLGYTRFCAHNSDVYIGNIQTSTEKEKISNISKKYKMSVLRLMFKSLCIFFKDKSFTKILLTSTKERIILVQDATHKLKTDYDTLFEQFGCILDAGRWKFCL